MRAMKFELLSSTHPENHYGRATLGIDERSVSLVVRNDVAFQLSALMAHAYAVGRRDATEDAVRAVCDLRREGQRS